ncbi:MAG: hypothetical protein IPI04_15905 [Ignavibacteria bacterium]|nr:hypothetical protein [Ignavibacteria bacterium]
MNWTATAFHEVCLSLVMNGNNLYAGTYNGVFILQIMQQHGRRHPYK